MRKKMRELARLLQIINEDERASAQKAEIIRNFPPHTLAAYGGGTLPLAPHPSIGGGSFLPAYVDGSNFNKAAIIASQAAAVS